MLIRNRSYGVDIFYLPRESKYTTFKDPGPKHVWILRPQTSNIGYLDPLGSIWVPVRPASDLFVEPGGSVTPSSTWKHRYPKTWHTQGVQVPSI